MHNQVVPVTAWTSSHAIDRQGSLPATAGHPNATRTSSSSTLQPQQQQLLEPVHHNNSGPTVWARRGSASHSIPSTPRGHRDSVRSSINTNSILASVYESLMPWLKDALANQEIMLVLSPKAFRWWWVFVVLLQIGASAYYALFLGLYVEIKDSTSRLHQVVKRLDFAIHISDAMQVATIVSMAIVVLLYWTAIGKTVVNSLQKRQLVLAEDPEPTEDGSPRALSKGHSQWIQSVLVESTTPLVAQVQQQMSLKSWFRQMISDALSVRNVDHKKYLHTVTLRTLVQVILQSLFAFHTSQWFLNLYVNRVLSALIVFNCWFTPLLHWTFNDDAVWLRMSLLFKGVFVDCGVFLSLIPLIALPHADIFEEVAVESCGVSTFWRKPLKLAHIQVALPEVFPTTWPLLALQIENAIVLLSYLEDLKAHIKLMTPRRKSTTIAPKRLTKLIRGLSARRKKSVANNTDASFSSIRPPSYFREFICLLLLLHGVLVVVVYELAYHRKLSSICLAGAAPWLESRDACSIVEINCRTLKINGSDQELAPLLVNLKASSLVALGFTDCPRLEIPTSVQEYHALSYFTVVNSTIRQWSDHAALRESTNPMLLFVDVINVNMTEYPEGLRANDFVARSIAFYQTNLTILPEDLDQALPDALDLLAIEQSQLQVVPAFLTRRHYDRFSLAGNHIQRIPDAMLSQKHFTALSFAANPILELPASTINATFDTFNMQHTLVASLPKGFVLQQAFVQKHRLVARQSPLCAPYAADPNANEELHWVCDQALAEHTSMFLAAGI